MSAASHANWIFVDCWAQVAESYGRYAPIKSHFLCPTRHQAVKLAVEDPHRSPAPVISADPAVPSEGEISQSAPSRKRKRKKVVEAERQRNAAEAQAAGRHAAVQCSILAAWQAFMSHRSQLIPAVTPTENMLAVTDCPGRSKACEELDYVALARRKHELYPKIRIGKDGKNCDLFDRVVRAPVAGEEVEAFLMKTRILLPSGSAFVMSDISRIQPLLDEAIRISGFDMMIIDPPWENASARRSQTYGTLPNYHFFCLPIRELLAKQGGSIVGLWVTNREKLRRFVEDELLKHWGLRQVATWYWLKTTSDGNLVTSLDSEHRRPYEPLVLARLATAEDHDATCSSKRTSGPQPPDNLVIIAEPGSHSRKPRVGHLLKQYTREQPKCAELFARELEKDWTSWGNEVLKFQDSSMFQRKEQLQEDESQLAPDAVTKQPPALSLYGKGDSPLRRGAVAGCSSGDRVTS